MTVATTPRLAGPFTGTGASASLPFSFKVFATSDVVVWRNSAVLANGDDYTVVLNSDQDTAPGGSVEILATAYTLGSSVYVETNVTAEQQVALTNLGGFYPKVVERAFDRLTILIQQLLSSVSRGGLGVGVSRAGKYLAFDAEGDPIAASGTGADSALRTDLAANGGSSLLLDLAVGVGAVPRSQRAKNSDTLSVKEFGALGNGVNNDHAAITLAVAAAVAAGCELVFPAGTYVHASTLSFGFTGLPIRALGTVIFKHTGAGRALSFDGGAAGGGIYRVRMLGAFTVRGNVATTDAVYCRAMHHSTVEAEVDTACTTGLRTEWCVCSEFPRFTCSVNEGNFTTVPTSGIWLDKRAAGEYTSYCKFDNLLVEGVVTGIVLASTLGNQFYGGTVEACTKGVYGSGAKNNKFHGTDFENNSSMDIDLDLSSNSNEFYGVDTGKLFRVTSGNDNLVVGGQHESLTFTAGTNNSLINVRYNRNGTGALTETVAIRKINVQNVGGGVWLQNTGVYSPQTFTGVAPGASPYLYTNSKNYPLELFINSGTVSQITFKRGALELVTATATDKSVVLDPGDQCRISYSVAPSLNEVPR